MIQKRKSRFGHMLMFLSLAVLLNVSSVGASGFVDQFRELDQSVVCLVLWFTPPVVVLMVGLGLLLIATGQPDGRRWGKFFIINAVVGLLLVVLFLLLSTSLISSITIDVCFDDSGSTITRDGSGITPFENTPPVAVASTGNSFTPGSDSVTVKKGDTVYFTAEGSMDADGRIDDYLWTFGDGSSGTGNEVTHKYGRVGTYTATLKVRDERGTVSKPVTVTVNVEPAGSIIINDFDVAARM